MDKIILKDGTEYGCEWVGVSGTLSAQLITDKPFLDVVTDFANPEKTESMVYHYNNKGTTYDGFTDLHMVQKHAPGYLLMLMKAE